jgi:hypothetical protein
VYTETDPVFAAWLSTYTETDPVFAAWLLATPPVYTETDPNSIHLDQAAPQSFTGGAVTGSGLLKVTAGELGIDTTSIAEILANIDMNPSTLINLNSIGTKSTLVAGESIVAGDILYYKNDGKVWKAKADATSTVPCHALAIETKNANESIKVLLKGYYRNDALYNWTTGGQASAAAGLLYVSANTAGAITQTRPATATNIVQILGHAYSADIVYFDPSSTFIEIV